MRQQKITVIIVTYDSGEVIQTCLRSIPPDVPVLIVDNGSVDDTVTLASHPALQQVIMHQNIGYGNAANVALAQTKTPYALLLNPDVVLSPGSLDTMLLCAKQDQSIGLVGARMFQVVNGGKLYAATYPFDSNGVYYTDWIVGACMLIDMDAIHRVGPFDKNIFLYFEETDLCDRFHAAGYKLAICARAEAQHEIGKSSKPSLRITKIKSWHFGWSKAYYIHKRFGLAKAMRKSFIKLYKNLGAIIVGTLSFDAETVIPPAYESMGLLSYFMGIKAFTHNRKARIT